MCFLKLDVATRITTSRGVFAGQVFLPILALNMEGLDQMVSIIAEYSAFYTQNQKDRMAIPAEFVDNSYELSVACAAFELMMDPDPRRIKETTAKLTDFMAFVDGEYHTEWEIVASVLDDDKTSCGIHLRARSTRTGMRIYKGLAHWQLFLNRWRCRQSKL